MLLNRQAYKVPGILRKLVHAPCPDQGGQMEDGWRERSLCLDAVPVWPPPSKAESTSFVIASATKTLLAAASPSVRGELWRQHSDLENAVTR